MDQGFFAFFVKSTKFCLRFPPTVWGLYCEVAARLCLCFLDESWLTGS
jgi:hypothetical protein